MKRISFRLERPWIPYLTFCVAIVITCLATYYVSHSAQERDNLRFTNVVQRHQNAINTELDVYTALLRGSSGLFAEDSNVTESEFKSYVNRLLLPQHYPGVQGIGYIMHEKQGQNTYDIATYFEPKDDFGKSLINTGKGKNGVIRKALDQARDTGLPTASGKIQLPQIHKNQPQAGFMIFVPVYASGIVPNTVTERRNNLIGYVYSPFRLHDLLKNIIDFRQDPSVTFQIYDGTTTSPDHLLYDFSISSRVASPTGYTSLFHTQRTASIAGTTWTISYMNLPSFETASQQNLPPFIFIGGLLMSIMFFMLSRSQYLARTRAEINAKQLKDSERKLQKAVGMRDNFISIASHELKTPVTSMKVYGEVLARRFAEKGDLQAVDYLNKINKQITKLTLLIRDLLDVSRLEAGHLSLSIEKFDSNEMLKEVVDNIQPLINKHKITIKGKAKKMVWGDKERIGQVVNNFITNALKYSPHSDTIIIESNNSPSHVTFSVQDFGIGISKQNQKKVFSRFYRVNGAKEQTYPGLGIGLYICHEIIRRHGSTISIKSSLNKGSTFSFSLPTQKSRIPKSSL